MILKDPFGCSVEPGLRVRVGVRMGAKVGADGPGGGCFCHLGKGWCGLGLGVVTKVKK